MRSQLELVPIVYHLAYFQLLEDADFTELEKFLNAVGDTSKIPFYAQFTTNRPHREIIRELSRILRGEFYHVLAFDRGDGTFYLESRPKDASRARMRLSVADQSDMLKSFDEVWDAVEAKANLKYDADLKRQKPSW